MYNNDKNSMSPPANCNIAEVLNHLRLQCNGTINISVGSLEIKSDGGWLSDSSFKINGHDFPIDRITIRGGRFEGWRVEINAPLGSRD